MTASLPIFPPDLVGPTLFVNRVLLVLDGQGYIRFVPARDEILRAVRIVATGADVDTSRHVAETKVVTGQTDGGSCPPATTAKCGPETTRRRLPGEYSDQELVDLLKEEAGKISALACRLGCQPKAVRYQLIKRGLKKPGARTR
jgi:hypothetical protein